MSVTTAILMLMLCFVSAHANPLLEDILQYDVLFTAKYVKTGSSAKFVIQEKIKGKIEKRVRNRVRIFARVALEDNQMVLFKFWKNGSKEFGMNGLDSKLRVCDRLPFFIKINCISIKEIAEAVKKKAQK